MKGKSPSEKAFRLASIFIQFTYDRIERSRRNAIREAILLARTSNDDKEIRSRILSYLQEGEELNVLELYIEDEIINFNRLINETLNKIETYNDAEEIRGNAIRLLESSPNHPALRISRFVAEMMSSNAMWYAKQDPKAIIIMMNIIFINELMILLTG